MNPMILTTSLGGTDGMQGGALHAGMLGAFNPTGILLRWLGLESGADPASIVSSQWVASTPVAGWILGVVIVLGLILAVVNFHPRLGMRPSVRIWTFLLRLAMVGIVVLVLLGAEWHLGLRLNEPQRWLVLVDDSASMATADVNSSTRFAAALADLKAIRDAADANVKLDVASFSGKPLGDAPSEGPTRFREVLQREVLARRRLDRVILLTDGRDSEASDLTAIGEDVRARGVALDIKVYGANEKPHDTGIHADADRPVIRLGEELIVHAGITGATGPVTVTLKENGKPVKTQDVGLDGLARFDIAYKPAKKGRYTYTVELGGGDVQRGNDVSAFVVDVVEEKINVLLIDGYPRFEFKLFKTVLEVDSLVNLVTISHLPGGGVYVQGEPLHRNPEQGLIESQAELFKYDVVILRDVSRLYFKAGADESESRLRQIVEFVTKRGGGLMVTGGQDMYRAGGYEKSHLAAILPFDQSAALGTEAQYDGLFFVGVPGPAYEHPLLRLLPDAVENRDRLNSMRELDGSNNVGRFKPMATPLLTRTWVPAGADPATGSLEVPILAYMPVGEGKVVASSVDTMWRWQLQADFDDPPLTKLLANIVRYIAPPPDRKPGQPNVGLIGGSPQVGRDLEMVTELRDKNFDPIREADLEVKVTLPDGSLMRLLPRDLPEEPGVYRYSVPVETPGLYKVQATYQKFDSVREFLAGAAVGEFADLSADRPDMALLATAAAGRVVADGAAAPGGTWLTPGDMAPTQVSAVRALEVWNSVPVLLLFLLLVSLDTFIRKRQGLA